VNHNDAETFPNRQNLFQFVAKCCSGSQIQKDTKIRFAGGIGVLESFVFPLPRDVPARRGSLASTFGRQAEGKECSVQGFTFVRM
jgi:hypothetical protein